MTPRVPTRRLKMNARRRSPFMLLLGFLSLGAPTQAAARGAGPRRDRAAVADRLPEEFSPDRAREAPAVPPEDLLEPWYRIEPEPRVRMLWQVGVQKTWVSGRQPSRASAWAYDDRQLTHDLGLLVRDGDGRHHWGGATTLIWQDYDRNLYGFKAIRRWSLDPHSDTYLQLAPGLIVGGEQGGVDITPGGLLELEVGNTWVALTTGVHVIGWRANAEADFPEAERGTNTTAYVGLRTHGLIGLGVYLGLFIAFAATYNGGLD